MSCVAVTPVGGAKRTNAAAVALWLVVVAVPTASVVCAPKFAAAEAPARTVASAAGVLGMLPWMVPVIGAVRRTTLFAGTEMLMTPLAGTVMSCWHSP